MPGTRFYFILTLLAATAACATGTAAYAVELNGVRLADRVRIDDGPPLQLNGAGVRVEVVFKVYVAALYLPVPNHEGEAILRSDAPSRFVMQLLRGIKAETFRSSIDSALMDTLTPEQAAPVRERFTLLDEMLSGSPDLPKGTQIVIDYVPGKGTSVRIDGQDKGVIPGADFHEALLRMWIGDSPRDTRLKRALLGTQ